MKRIRQLIDPFLVRDGKRFRLGDVDPSETMGLRPSKREAKKVLKDGIARLAGLQETLYAQDRWGVLLIFQAIDAAGKDSVIKHVMSGVNPQGCQVYSFKQPSPEELDHDFMWRTSVKLPERGRIGIFNRSYYEEVVVVRVHPEILERQKLPKPLITKQIWNQRYEDIRHFERYLSRQGFVVLKFFLHISKSEQERRFLKRLDHPEKNWKFSSGDLKERDRWNDYMKAYEAMIRNTAAKHAPWVVVPANKKWFARWIVAASIIDAMDRLDLAFPELDAAQKRDMARARAVLMKGRKKR